MKLVTDAHYTGNQAVVAGVLFDNWDAAEPANEYIVNQNNIADYEPGSFYKRELPCLLALISEIKESMELIVVDGFVTLGTEQRPGLGCHLYEKLGCRVPIVGVAKTAFAGTPKECEVLRGRSKNPLYVTAAGICLDEAKIGVNQMHGQHRIPTLLKRVDYLCRHGA